MMMKLSWLIIWATVSAGAQVVITHSNPSQPNGLNDSDFTAAAPAPVILDNYRVLNGVRQRVDYTWLAVSGRVVQVHPKEGLRVDGYIEGAAQPSDFFVVNLPVSAAEGEWLPPKGVVLLVKDAGTYTYSTAAGSTRTIRKYDYGLPCDAPQKSASEIAQEKRIEDRKKIEMKAAVLKFNQDQAAAGDPDGQLRMAERYRDGDGVETNLFRAKALFELSADQKDEAAIRELAALTNSHPNLVNGK